MRRTFNSAKLEISKLTLAVCAFTLAGSAIYPAHAMSPAEQSAIYGALMKGDYATAVPLMKKAANDGDTNCQKNLATLYTTGIPGVLAKNDAEALSLYTKAAAKLDGDALAALGNAHMSGLLGVQRDYPKALEYFDKAIAQGNSRGKAGRATLYLKGWGVPQDVNESFKLMREASFQKVPGATYNLADFYRRGIGCEKNMTEALSLYAKAAPGMVQQVQRTPGSGQINCAVGMMYQNGWGVTKDTKLAAKYFALGLPRLKSMAAAGETSSMLFLAELTEHGWGVPKNVAASQALVKRAADKGDGEAKWTLEHPSN